MSNCNLITVYSHLISPCDLIIHWNCYLVLLVQHSSSEKRTKHHLNFWQMREVVWTFSLRIGTFIPCFLNGTCSGAVQGSIVEVTQNSFRHCPLSPQNASENLDSVRLLSRAPVQRKWIRGRMFILCGTSVLVVKNPQNLSHAIVIGSFSSALEKIAIEHTQNITVGFHTSKGLLQKW